MMRIPRFARVLIALCVVFFLVQIYGCASSTTTLTIATVNNRDMLVMRELSGEFTKANPNIFLKWVFLDENMLRRRVSKDISIEGGQFDVLTISTYEAPMWGKKGSLRSFESFDQFYANYDADDILRSVREGLSSDGKLYALPFSGESSMLYYRKDLFQQAGITVPEQLPTYTQIREWAAKIHKPNDGVYGICLRGKPGWGENVAFLSTMVNAYNGQWFDAQWNPQLTSAPWHNAVNDYVSLLKQYGPPDPSSNGFNENQKLFSMGKCGMWVDATVAAGSLSNPKESQVANQVGFALAPVQVASTGANWQWVWSLAIRGKSKSPDAAQKFVEWATSKDYIQLVAQKKGWVAVPPGTRTSTYANPEYKKVAPFADIVLKSIESAQPGKTAIKPYVGIQFVGIPEFQDIGDYLGKMIAEALTGQRSVNEALQRAQSATETRMKSAGYIK